MSPTTQLAEEDKAKAAWWRNHRLDCPRCRDSKGSPLNVCDAAFDAIFRHLVDIDAMREVMASQPRLAHRRPTFFEFVQDGAALKCIYVDWSLTDAEKAAIHDATASPDCREPEGPCGCCTQGWYDGHEAGQERGRKP